MTGMPPLRRTGRLLLLGAVLVADLGCSRSLPTASVGNEPTPIQEPITGPDSLGGSNSPRGTVSPATAIGTMYKGFAYPQCTYTAAYWFDNFPQSKAGFPSPGQNWRGNAVSWDLNAYNAGWLVWWSTPNVGSLAVRLRLAGAILVWDAVPNNSAGHVGVIMSSDASGAWVRESNWPLGRGQEDHYLSWSTIFNRGSYRLKGFVLRERR